MVTVGVQCLSVVCAIFLLAEELVLEGVDVSDVYPSSWFELVELVGRVWGFAQEGCKE